MKTQDSNQDFEVTSKSLPSRGRFRFPFKQKPILSMNSPPGSSPTSVGTPSSAYNLFNFRKIGTPKGQPPVSATPRKSVSFSGMDWKRKISTDHTDVAYREAVSRLRSILSPRPQSSLIDSSSIKGSVGDVSKAGDSRPSSPPTSGRRDRFNFRSIFSSKESPTKPQNLNNQLYSYPSVLQRSTSECEDDLFDYINKQNEYIAQLEKETKYCRDDMSNMLGKVRDVISENEALHERQKRDLLNNMIDQLDEKTDGYDLMGEKYGGVKKPSSMKKSSTGNLLLESKIAEMEAQLSQAKRSLQLAQEEILDLRKNQNNPHSQDHSSLMSTSINPYAHCDLHRAEIENLNREKQSLLETLSKFKSMMNELRDRESDAAKKVKNSLEIVETMQHEKTQSDMETRRLKDELERREQRVRELVTENCKKIHEEKMQVEMKYRQEIEMLNSNINVEMDALTRARLELERMKRNELELKRELSLKTQTMEDLRQENIIRMGHMQSELSQALLMKSQAEQDLINSRLLIEKVERDGKQEAAKLQAEITGLRQRMEASDTDLLQAQELIIKLNETIGHLQRENSILKARDGGSEDQDVVHIIHNMEEKHSKDMTDLEQLIQAQNGLVDKLSKECKMLTDKLDDTSKQYRQDLMVELQSCVSHITGYKSESQGDNENEKDNDKEKSSPTSSPPIDEKKIKGLLSELGEIVGEMSQWVEAHPINAADDEESEADEEDDDDEEESEEEDDDEEEAGGTGTDKEKAEGEDTEKEESEKKTDKKKDKTKSKEKNEDEDEEESEDDEEDADAEKDQDKKDGDAESSKVEGEEEKQKLEKKKSQDESAEQEGEEEEEGEGKSPKDKTEEKEEGESEKVKDAEEKVEESKETTEKEDSDKKDEKVAEKSDTAMIKIVEVNNQIEDWIKRIQNALQRFSSSFPSKAVC